MNNKLFIGLVVVAAGVLVGWYVMGTGGNTASTSGNQTISPTPAGSNLGAPPSASGQGNSLEKGGVAQQEVVVLTDSGFSPAVVIVKPGTVITFVNEGSGSMWVASDPHPTHTLLKGFDQKTAVAKGGSYSYTFSTVGTWTYHNHMELSQKGTVTVRE